jgi:hypothetical protein
VACIAVDVSDGTIAQAARHRVIFLTRHVAVNLAKNFYLNNGRLPRPLRAALATVPTIEIGSDLGGITVISGAA